MKGIAPVFPLMNCLRLQTEENLHTRKALAEKQKMHSSAALQLKLFGSEAAFFRIRLKPSLIEPDLRLKTEAIDKS